MKHKFLLYYYWLIDWVSYHIIYFIRLLAQGGTSSASELIVDLESKKVELETWLAAKEGESKSEDVNPTDILEAGDSLSRQIIDKNSGS